MARFPLSTLKSVGKIILVILLALAVFFGGLMLLESGSSDYGDSHYDHTATLAVPAMTMAMIVVSDYGGYDYSYDSGSSWDSWDKAVVMITATTAEILTTAATITATIGAGDW